MRLKRRLILGKFLSMGC